MAGVCFWAKGKPKTEIPVKNKEGGMRNHQRVIGVALTICLVLGLCGDWVTNLRAATLPNSTLTKQQVELFGVGADVKVKLTSGKKLRGSIGGIDAQSFDLISRRDRSPRRITYDQVTQLVKGGEKLGQRGGGKIDHSR